jgi:hypothetical protein
VAQPPPEAGRSYRAFPARALLAGRRLWRVARHSPSWFCSAGDCRFDLRPPRGTCYLATDELTGLLEVLGPGVVGMVVPPSLLAGRTLFGLDLAAPVRLANTTSRRAAGVTNQLAAMTPYGVPRAWASTFRAAGFDGIAYRARFDPGPPARGVALFGRAGEAGWPVAECREIDRRLLDLLERDCGVRVSPTPRLSQLVPVGVEDPGQGPG